MTIQVTQYISGQAGPSATRTLARSAAAAAAGVVSSYPYQDATIAGRSKSIAARRRRRADSVPMFRFSSVYL